MHRLEGYIFVDYVSDAMIFAKVYSADRPATAVKR